MQAAVCVERSRIVLEEPPVPDVGPLDALIRITTTTICGTEVHIQSGAYPVARGLTIGHEPLGVTEQLGSALTGCREDQRVIAAADMPGFISTGCPAGARRKVRERNAASSPLEAGASAT
jgi:alcohol dehydrogenase